MTVLSGSPDEQGVCQASDSGTEVASPDLARGAGRPPVAGWKERVDLPELGIRRLKAKLDTGARSSALHVSGLRILRHDPAGRHDVELDLVPRRRHPEAIVTARVRLVGTVEVTDSGGHRERRPLIETLLVLGPLRRRIRISLTDRSGMLFPLILGRKAFEGAFLIDVAAKYLLRRRAGRGMITR